MSKRSILSGALRATVGTTAIVGLGKLLQLLLLALLARIASEETFGLLATTFNVAVIGAVLVTVGLTNGSIRFVAAYVATRDWGSLSGFLRFSSAICLGAMVLCAVASLAAFLAGAIDATTALAGFALTVAFAFGGVRQGVGLGFGKTLQALAPRELAAPVLSAAMLLPLVFLPRTTWDDFAALAFVLGFVVAEAIGYRLIVRSSPPELSGAEPRMRQREWLTSLVPMWATTLLLPIQQRIDLVFVSVFMDLRTAALYAAAQRIAQTFNVLIRIVGFAISPQIAKNYHAGALKAADRYVLAGTGIGLLFAVPLAIGMYVFGRLALAAFGPTFVSAFYILMVLVVGQAIYIASAPISVALTLTSRERPQAIFLAAQMVVLLPALYLAATHGSAILVALATVVSIGASALFMITDYLLLRRRWLGGSA